jgi:dTDP-4-dehydrorhamnose reductase
LREREVRVARVLIFGSTGQVARELIRARWPEGTALTSLDRAAADLTRPESLAGIVQQHRPDLVVIAAAYTAVDAAEDDEETANLVNAVAPGAIARAAAELSVPVVHFSTDYVFDGEKGSPYIESDAVNPINAYGRTKLAGEQAIRDANPKHVILRTSWIYAASGKNFVLTMLNLAEAQDEVSVVVDQRGCPTAAHDLASAVAGIAGRLVRGDVNWGTYHLVGASETTWHGFAEAIFGALATRGYRPPVNHAVSTSVYPKPARRPRDSRLSSEAFVREFGLRPAGFETALPEVLREALGEAPQREAS